MKVMPYDLHFSKPAIGGRQATAVQNTMAAGKRLISYSDRVYMLTSINIDQKINSQMCYSSCVKTRL